MEMLHIVLAAVGALLAVSFTVVFAGRVFFSLVYPLCALLCLTLLGADLSVLLSPAAGGAAILPFGLPGIGVHLRLDVLAAAFGIVVNLGGLMSSVYGIGYGRGEKSPMRILPFFAAFLAGMNLVLLADDAFTFLVAWEFMSVTSWALVISNHREKANAHAAYTYLLMANAGTVALLFAFGVLAGPSGGYAFDTIRAAAHPSWVVGVAVVMAMLGAGSKAGLVPLHVWLPMAHPAAPSHVSSLMSGVMTKVAIYALIRIIFDLCGPVAWGWSIPLLVFGAVTAAMGIMYATMQSDIKKLLAYSTVENVGFITVGLGLALAFRASAMPALAAVALVAALLHVFNHSLFKSLMFMGAGAIDHATGTRDIDRMGGLIHRMPSTAVMILVGCAAVAALPPLNGFVSEWMLFQSILSSPQLPQPLLHFLVPAVGVALMLAAALAAAAFVKLFGVSFLGRPRSDEAAQAHETDGFSRTAMGMLVFLCIAAGLFAAPMVDSLAPLTSKLVGGAMPAQHSGPALLSLTPFTVAHSSYNAPLLLLFMLVSGALTAWCIHAFASRRTRVAPVWDCGFPYASPRTQYTASSFAQPLRRIFGPGLFAAKETVDMPVPGDMRAASIKVHLSDLIWDYAYAPVARAVWAIADRINKVQFLTIRRYLVLMFAALIILLVVVALWHP
ncbi:MAG: hydrogenase 4 subunit B [Alphaproteobacteria bacterium]|nr:hydrogenase 4 subunit B [Alphaproteobacteria bacterium]